MTDVQAPPETKMVAGVRFTKVGKLYHFDYSDYPDLELGDYVIVETARGRHMGQILGFTRSEGREHRSILRPATPRDLVLKQYWESKEAEALVVCREQAQRLGAYRDVKFIAAQYNYDGSVLTFLYGAEQKVDVSRLWYVLKRSFSSQVEMRHIGPRDVAKLLGGYGACGELRCCSTFLTDFSPISIKMAKMQGISLNPSEITGMCGRLRCCLVYEYEQYVEARKQLPKRNKRIGTPMGEAKVIDVHPLSDSVTVFIEGEGRRTFARDELIPLEELRALEQKAKEPCNKHGDEPCDCGQKPGKRGQDRPKEAKAGKRDDKSEDSDKKSNKKRRDNKRRGGKNQRRRRSNNKNRSRKKKGNDGQSNDG